MLEAEKSKKIENRKSEKEKEQIVDNNNTLLLQTYYQIRKVRPLIKEPPEWDTSTTDIEGARNSKKRFCFVESERHGTLLKILHALKMYAARTENKIKNNP